MFLVEFKNPLEPAVNHWHSSVYVCLGRHLSYFSLFLLAGDELDSETLVDLEANVT